MKFEVYCDEANPDILTSASPRVQYLLIGSLWLPAELREEIKAQITTLRSRYSAWGEIKWSKVSPNRHIFRCRCHVGAEEGWSNEGKLYHMLSSR